MWRYLILIAVFATGVFVGNVGKPVQQAPSPSPSPRGLYDAFTFTNVLIKANEARLTAGKEQLGFDKKMNELAQKRAREIGEEKCGHEGFLKYPESSEWTELGACGYKTVPLAIQGLLDSPTHKDGLLDEKYRAIGVGVYRRNIVILLRP